MGVCAWEAGAGKGGGAVGGWGALPAHPRHLLGGVPELAQLRHPPPLLRTRRRPTRERELPRPVLELLRRHRLARLNLLLNLRSVFSFILRAFRKKCALCARTRSTTTQHHKYDE